MIELLVPCVISRVIVRSAERDALMSHLNGLNKLVIRWVERKYAAQPHLITEQSKAAGHEGHKDYRYETI